MPFRSRSIAREFSSAVAVLAVYLLVLLVPLHQASGLQRDLVELGHAAPSAWALCEAASPGTGGDGPSIGIKCPLAGVGKQDLIAAEPGSLELGTFRRTATGVSYPYRPGPPRPTVDPHVGQARAPPMTV